MGAMALRHVRLRLEMDAGGCRGRATASTVLTMQTPRTDVVSMVHLNRKKSFNQENVAVKPLITPFAPPRVGQSRPKFMSRDTETLT